ncbi:LysM peptidoglycan-binding domain-containing protein [Glycomyces sp. NPDC047010]|uniref:LysM peptidoglycan-binding domain-containing protein n=1 Tax=Glycomyces sp. NPDC047010 TaxID=3155023 RepID=UPI0033F8EDD1
MTRTAVQQDRVPTNAASLAARALWGTAAGLGLAALLVGVPIVLTAAFGWPPTLPTGDEITYWHLHEADLAWKLLGLAGWAVWAWMTVVLIGQIIHALRWGLSPQTLRDSASPARWLAGALIGAVAAAIPTSWASAASPAVPAATSLDTGDTEAAPTPATTARPLVWENPNNAATVTASVAGDHAAAAEAVADPADEPEATVHTVKRGENPWGLAEHYYGDGAKWRAIWEANQSTVQPDGRTYTDPGQIHPGWQLIIPDHTDSAEETDEDGFVHEIVEDGEHLWGYAEQYLGDGTRYGEIVDANEGRVFADGRTLTDPDVIVNGWDLLIPTAPATDTDPPAEAVPEPNPADGPAEGDDGPVPDTPPPPPSGDPGAPTPETSGEPTGPESGRSADDASAVDDDPSSSNTLFDAVPFGIWLTGGTCLAAATVAALAAHLRRKRSTNLRDAESASTDEPMTGRLSDLEAVIEAENRKLTTPADYEPGPKPVPVAVGADRAPVDLRHLTEAGIGLLGPGQHGVVRAAIVAAATAGVQVRLTESANLRLDLDAEQVPWQVRMVADLVEATVTEPGSETVVVCADTEIDATTRPGMDRFLGADGHGAIILGDWAPATVRVAGDGTVEDTTGLPDNLGMLHIADRDTATALLTALQDDDRASASEPDPIEAPADGPAPEPSPGDKTQKPGTIDETTGEAHDAPTPAADTAPPQSAPYLCLFGTPELYVGDRPVVFKKGKRAKAFLAALALAEGPLSRAELMNAVLPGYDDPVKARTNLNTIGSSLRGNLQEATGTDTSVYHWDKATDRYELEPGAFVTDRDAFDAAEQSAALASDPAEAAAHLEEAARLYIGDLAPDLHTSQIEELRTQYRAAAARALRKLADHHAETGDAARAEHFRSRAQALASEADPS